MLEKTVPISPSSGFWCLNTGQLSDLQLLWGWGGGVKIQNQQFSCFLLPYLPTQPVEKVFSGTAKRSWHQFPHSTERRVFPPSYTSVWSPAQQQQQQQRYRPADWAVRAANYIRHHRQQQLWFLSWQLLKEHGMHDSTWATGSNDRIAPVFTHRDKAALSEHLVIQSLCLRLRLQETKVCVLVTSQTDA